MRDCNDCSRRGKEAGTEGGGSLVVKREFKGSGTELVKNVWVEICRCVTIVGTKVLVIMDFWENVRKCDNECDEGENKYENKGNGK